MKKIEKKENKTSLFLKSCWNPVLHSSKEAKVSKDAKYFW